MFKRFTIILIAIFIVSILLLTFSWNSNPGLEVYSSSPVTKVYRLSKDLGGKWNEYSTLKQAWAREELLSDNGGYIRGLQQPESVIVPSSKGLSVIAKKFRISSQWGSRTVQLVLEGVYGQTKVYLNGIDDINYLGELNGIGGIHKLDIPPASLDFSRENTLFIEITSGSDQKEKLLGWIWPDRGRITGQIRLEAVPETTLDTSVLSYAYNQSSEQLIVTAVLSHHRNLDKEPWVINGVLKDNQRTVAECLLPVNSNGMYTQKVDLLFNLPSPVFWSIENPYVYNLQLSVINSRGDLDSVHIPLGISSASTEAEYINGLVVTQIEDYQIRNKHFVDEWMQNTKDKGFNLVYFMGFFPDESWLYAADRIGMGIWLELPVNMVPGKRLPDPNVFNSLLNFDSRHPSILAWTLAKNLEPSQEKAEQYLSKAHRLIPDKPVYHLHFSPDGEVSGDVINSQFTADGFEGTWGKVKFYADFPLEKNNVITYWKEEKIAAIIWFILLALLSIQRFRFRDWNYDNLISPNPRRLVREAYFWRCLYLVLRVGTLAGIVTSLFFKLSLDVPPWFPYDMELISILKSQNPFLIWLFLSMFLAIYRLLQVGVAGTAFPHSPSTLGLACWLERRYGWILLIGLAWVLTFYYIPSYFPLIIYIILSLVFFPIRMMDVRKSRGKYIYLLIMPMTLIIIVSAACLKYGEDIIYMWTMVLPLITGFLSQISLHDWLNNLSQDFLSFFVDE